MRYAPKTILLQAGIIALAMCVDATAMHAWHTRVQSVDKAGVATGGMSNLIRELHNNAHHLPVQVIEDYN
jgi:hypothetical protein